MTKSLYHVRPSLAMMAKAQASPVERALCVQSRHRSLTHVGKLRMGPKIEVMAHFSVLLQFFLFLLCCKGYCTDSAQIQIVLQFRALFPGGDIYAPGFQQHFERVKGFLWRTY